MDGAVVIVGGTSGLGLRLAETYAARGRDVVITGRDADRCVRRSPAGIAGRHGRRRSRFDLAEPETIAAAPRAGRRRRPPRARRDRARREPRRASTTSRARLRLVTLKLVGYTEVVHTLAPRLAPGRVDPPLRRAGAAPAVSGLDDGHDRERRRLRARRARWRVELAPIRVNAHPSRHRRRLARVGGRSPRRSSATSARTPLGRTVTMDEIVGRLDLPARERRRERGQPRGRRRMAAAVDRSASPSSGSGRWARRSRERILDAGYPLVVFNRTPERAEPLAARGRDGARLGRRRRSSARTSA